MVTEVELFDEVWNAIRDSGELANAKKKLSIAELRIIVQLAATPFMRENEELRKQLSEISEAIGSVRFMDPPDGGDVNLADQVKRMARGHGELQTELSELLERHHDHN